MRSIREYRFAGEEGEDCGPFAVSSGREVGSRGIEKEDFYPRIFTD